ncbi:MAG: hypothetical protein AABY22_29295 [Nanoarchaeota archaeon]
MTELWDLLKRNAVNYEYLSQFSTTNISPRFDLNIIIPVRGRFRFIDALYQSFLEAKKHTSLNIAFTIAEVSRQDGYHDFCKKNGLYYLF